MGLLVIPYLAHAMGPARFGILALIWAALGYFGVFDFAVARATTRMVALRLATGRRDELRDLFNTSLALQASLGVLGGVLLALATPPLVAGVLGLSGDSAREATVAFYWTAGAIPAVLVSGGLRALLEAAQRFDLANWVRAPASAANFLMPAIGVALGFGLPGMIALLFGARTGLVWVAGVLVRRGIPEATPAWPHKWNHVRSLISFGGWVSVSNVVSPVLIYGDRFLLGWLSGAAAVAYYAAPYEAITRLLIIPGSLAAVVFPAVSAAHGQGAGKAVRPLVAAAILRVALWLVPVLLLVAIFATDLLTAWLGPAYAAEGSIALAVLAAGVAANGIGQVLYGGLHGVGRPDLTAAFHLLELPIYAGLAWWLVSRFGVPGAATAWTVRVALDAGLLGFGFYRATRR